MTSAATIDSVYQARSVELLREADLWLSRTLVSGPEGLPWALLPSWWSWARETLARAAADASLRRNGKKTIARARKLVSTYPLEALATRIGKARFSGGAVHLFPQRTWLRDGIPVLPAGLLIDNPDPLAPFTADDLGWADGLYQALLMNIHVHRDLERPGITPTLLREALTAELSREPGTIITGLHLPYPVGELDTLPKVPLALLRPGQSPVLVRFSDTPDPVLEAAMHAAAADGAVSISLRWDSLGASTLHLPSVPGVALPEPAPSTAQIAIQV